jgi:hypothetical protein
MPMWLSRVSLDPYIRQRAYSLPCRAIPGTRQRIKTCGIILDDISLPCAAPLTLGKGLAICHLLCLRHSIDLCDLSAHGATVFVVYLPKTLAKASAPLATRKRPMAFLCRVSHLNKWQSFFCRVPPELHSAKKLWRQQLCRVGFAECKTRQRLCWVYFVLGKDHASYSDVFSRCC